MSKFIAVAVSQRSEEMLQRQDYSWLSNRNFEFFVQIMTAESEPTKIALFKAASFKQGQMVGQRYRWTGKVDDIISIKCKGG